ncbi:MAG: cupin domain-containing protein [Candidatus Cloacimonetes bacterium]|jgi:quercetin dioxygenase-like cupin family protein|nr:cupin domain-containing protein [Candidatus Cloacimonadota bacterium]MBT6994605.1 cupin domain-containing protein [Candidatus Cloacimonadota bacterium]MBT7469267.1 cupin domain-containing protein [Candidatus Cloacimonadota bacterium]
MKLANFKDVKLEDVSVEGAKNTKIRWLISKEENAPNFAMRMFEVEKGGNTPFHKHAWEHEVFVVEGDGLFVTEWGKRPFKAGDFIFVDPQEMHQFQNAGDSILRFLCVIPHEKKTVKTMNPFATGKANNC